MEELISILTTLVLLFSVIFVIRIFNKTIQEDIKEFKEKYQFTKKLISTLKDNNTYFK